MPEWQVAAGGKMSFDVASVRPSAPNTFTPPNVNMTDKDYIGPTGGVFKADYPLAILIGFAYKLSADERKLMQESLPKWATTDAFTIRAESENHNPTKDQMRLMMQSLLADRFKLALHLETRQTPALILRPIKPGKLGPKLRAHADGPPCDTPVHISPGKFPDVFPPDCGSYVLAPTTGKLVMWGSRDTTLDLLASSFGDVGKLERPVVNRTGLDGKFDFTLEWTWEPNASPAVQPGPQDDLSATTFPEAVNEQLGLRLEPAVLPFDVLVIDHVEKPTEN